MVRVLRILVVDDQRRTRESLKALLAAQFQGIEMHEASNGAEAIRCVEDWKPDLVLMDARMPELDGVEATRRLKRQRPHIKVIVLSMFAEYQAGALAAGADAFIGKGEPPERLLAALAAAVGSNASPGPRDDPAGARAPG
jgi:CheY-like chemotaxis protein